MFLMQCKSIKRKKKFSAWLSSTYYISGLFPKKRGFYSEICMQLEVSKRTFSPHSPLPTIIIIMIVILCYSLHIKTLVFGSLGTRDSARAANQSGPKRQEGRKKSKACNRLSYITSLERSSN